MFGKNFSLCQNWVVVVVIVVATRISILNSLPFSIPLGEKIIKNEEVFSTKTGFEGHVQPAQLL